VLVDIKNDMRERNPFLIRTAERINNEDDFIKLFSPKIIDLIKENVSGYSLWNQFFRFQSSPGGGKTSLLKLFSPTILHRIQKIFANRIESNQDIDSLFKSLKELDAYNDSNEVNVITLYITCASDYDTINNLNINDSKKSRLFISLLNVRIFISLIQTFIEYFKINNPKADIISELKKIKIVPNSSTILPVDFPINCNGYSLYQWSGTLEKKIYREIDGFKNTDTEIDAHSGLFSTQIINDVDITFDGIGKFPKNFAIFFDDIQKLAIEQYKLLTNSIIEMRPSIGIWYAERLDLFSLNDLWSKDASTIGRDYVEVNLEELFREKSKSKFKEFTINVAEKRMERALDMDLNSFPSFLVDDIGLGINKIEEIASAIINRINELHNDKNKYDSVLNYIAKSSYLSEFNRLLDLRIAQLLIERKEKKEKSEPSLFPSEYMVAEFLDDKKSFSSNMASYLLGKDFKIPYYFGYDNLVSISSSNIEQFLAFSGRLFENIISSRLMNANTALSAVEQEKILISEASNRWRDLNSLSLSREIKLLLDSIGQFCLSEDNKPGFSYRGVTGIALTLDDRNRLTDRKYWDDTNPHYSLISKVLTVAIANNLLEVKLESKQGKKGDPPKTIFYLNRWLCLKYGLSLGYSGWRKVNLDTLGKWINKGFKRNSQVIYDDNVNKLYDK